MVDTTSPLFENKQKNFAEVILPLALPTNYTYAVPDDLIRVQPGSRVEVELKNKKYAGIVKNIHQNKPTEVYTKRHTECFRRKSAGIWATT